MSASSSSFAYPVDLARFVRDQLRELHTRPPPLLVLTRMLEITFFASMKTEEGEAVVCNLIYISMERPDPNSPRRIVADRWTYVRFEKPILLTVSNLAKISTSLDSAVSSIAVDKDDSGDLVIWGAIDQQGQRAAFVAREIDEGAESPGVLQVSVLGVGTIEVSKDYRSLGALRQGRVAFGYNDVFERSGPISAAFKPALSSLVKQVQKIVGEGAFEKRDHWAEGVSDFWRQALARLLLTIQRYGHGGAMLVTPDTRNNGLRIKYPIRYERLSNALVRQSVNVIQHCDAEDEIYEGYLRTSADDMPVGLHLDETVSGNEEEDTRDEITGCVRFIASLSRVDGVVVANRELKVRGYSAIITVENEPASVSVAADPRGTAAKLRRIDPRHFGTRHQSMMRICFGRPGSVGFVVSQDGDVRAMTRVRNQLVVWEDVKLQLA